MSRFLPGDLAEARDFRDGHWFPVTVVDVAQVAPCREAWYWVAAAGTKEYGVFQVEERQLRARRERTA